MQKLSMFALLALSFVGCPMDEATDIDPRSCFYGTWFYSGAETYLGFDITIEISEHELHYKTTKGVDFTVSSLLWYKENNQKFDTTDEFPTGYRLSGQRSDGGNYNVPYFLHTSSKKISQNGYQTIFIKQN